MQVWWTAKGQEDCVYVPTLLHRPDTGNLEWQSNQIFSLLRLALKQLPCVHGTITEIYIENSISSVLNGKVTREDLIKWTKDNRVKRSFLTSNLIPGIIQTCFKPQSLQPHGNRVSERSFPMWICLHTVFLDLISSRCVEKKWEGVSCHILKTTGEKKIILRSFLNLFFNLYRDKRLTVEGSVIDTIASHLQKFSIESQFPVLQEICWNHFILRVRVTF